jgi:hypothetical protein
MTRVTVFAGPVFTVTVFTVTGRVGVGGAHWDYTVERPETIGR